MSAALPPNARGSWPPGADPWAKDCRCVDHTVPHWVYQDFAWRQSNREAFAATGSVHALAIEDRNRLAQKRWEMERRGIREVPPHVVAQAERDWCESPLAWARLHRDENASYLALADAFARELAVAHDLADGVARVGIAEQLAAVHARAAKYRAAITMAEATLAAGPRVVMSSAELARRAVAKASRADVEAVLGTRRAGP